jgi:hypothetical protein
MPFELAPLQLLWQAATTAFRPDGFGILDRGRIRAPHWLMRPSRCPPGKSTESLSSPARKNILLPFEGKSPAYFVRLIPHEGALAIVTNVGVRCGGREGAFDEQR